MKSKIDVDNVSGIFWVVRMENVVLNKQVIVIKLSRQKNTKIHRSTNISIVSTNIGRLMMKKQSWKNNRPVYTKKIQKSILYIYRDLRYNKHAHAPGVRLCCIHCSRRSTRFNTCRARIYVRMNRRSVVSRATQPADRRPTDGRLCNIIAVASPVVFACPSVPHVVFYRPLSSCRCRRRKGTRRY